MPELNFFFDIIKNNSVIVGAAGALVILLLRHFLTVSRANHVNQQTTGKIIAEAFIPELNSLSDVFINKNACSFLTDDAFKRHDSAIKNNIKGLSAIQRYRLRKAWRELAYYKNDKKNQMPFYEQYHSGGSLDERKKLSKLAIKRIQKIISIVNK